MSTLTVKGIAAPSGFNLVMPTGAVVQTVQNATSSQFTTNSTSEIDVTNMAITITPKFASSKILLWFQCGTEVNGTINGIGIKLYRGSSVIKQNGQYSYLASGGWNPGMAGFNYLYMDSPNTTSATTYKLSQNQEAAGVIYWNYGNASNGMTVIAQEISG